MYTILKKDLELLVAALKVTDLTKVTFTMFKGLVGDDKYACTARITSSIDELKVTFAVPKPEGDVSPVNFTVNGKKFVEVMDAILPFEKDIEWDLDNGKFNISIKDVTNISIPLEAEAVEEMVFANTGAMAFLAETKALVGVLRKGGLAAVKGSSVPQAGTVVLKVSADDKKLVCFSTDGKTLAISNGSVKQVQTKDTKELVLGIPVDAYERILKVISGSTENKVMFTENQFAISGANNSVYTCQLSPKTTYDANVFLNAWPSETEAGITVDNEALVNSINILNASAPDTDKDIKPFVIRNGNNSLVVEINGTENKVNIPATAAVGEFNPETEGGKTGVSPAILLKCIKALNKGNITLRTCNNANVPYIVSNGTLTEQDATCTLYIMRVRCN